MSLEQHIRNLISSQSEEEDYLKRQIEEMQKLLSSISIKKKQLETALLEKNDLEDAFVQLKQEHNDISDERDKLAARVKILEGGSQDDAIMNLKLKALKEGGPINMNTS